ncbi:hypothetical protein [Olleya sp.]|jgi:hypothetical protein|uniref:hypothetical protein n=1 Tax=Olleya sp. TaxID=1906788 RepID=UPI0032D91E79
MRIVIILGICLFVLVILAKGFTRLVGGISKKQASNNLVQYLTREYKGELNFKNLNRFFNSGNMNPNMFSVRIYNANKPEIEFYCHINLKTILEDGGITMSGLDVKTINDYYLEAIKRYDTRQAIKRIFKTEFSFIVFNNNSIDLTTDVNLESEALQLLLNKFITRLNYFYDDLDIYSDIALIIKTPNHPEGFIEVPLEFYDNKWSMSCFMLSDKATNFNIIESRIKRDLIKYLEQSQPNFEIYDSKKVYLDKNALSRAASVQYLSDKTVNNEGTVKYQNPLKGVYATYFDLETGHIYKGELITTKNDKISYDEELVLIKKTLQAEGVLAW